MNISPVTFSSFSFGSSAKASDKQPAPKQNSPQNPISSKGEKAKLIKVTFLGGLAVGARLLFELMDGDFIVNEMADKAEKIVETKHKEAKGGMKALLGIGAFAGLVAMFIGGFAILYTLFKAPKINYEGNINAYQKGKDMDVYIKGNEVEKELYTQMNEKAKNATAEEKAKLQTQYMQMQMAKNRVPDFVKA
ncbi:hypothetical protein IJ541_06880 [bacterium]|nr:hypothetical protein [bacterium]